MNIYLHIEVASREFDSKLLLGVIAASRGHSVFLSDLGGIVNCVKFGLFPPGIFHTKSLTPGNSKINRHQNLIEKGFQITSIDEEGGLVDYGYEKFARTRFSSVTLKQTAAIFCWGPEDAETLKSVYPESEAKFHQTGSPRCDLWRPRFADYWAVPKSLPEKPYLLFISNLSAANSAIPFYESMRSQNKAGYFQRDPDLFSRSFGVAEEHFRLTLCFIEAIRYLAEYNDDFDIVLRPHPAESIDAWKLYLEDIPNVHVAREGPISPWIRQSFAVVHNGCTSALEASISDKPIITFIPFAQMYSNRGLSLDLGARVENQEALWVAVNRLFRESHSASCHGDEGSYPTKDLPESVAQKIFIDRQELAAQKMIEVWENLENGKCRKSVNFFLVKSLLMGLKLKRSIALMLNKIKSNQRQNGQVDEKFPPIELAEIKDKVARIQRLLKLRDPLQCTLLSERTLVIRKNDN